MMKSSVLVFVLALWSVANAVQPNDASLDPRSSERINKRLKDDARHLCDVRCRQDNERNCVRETRHDLGTCEELIYWVYHSNYRTCMYRCKNECNDDSESSCDKCEVDCLMVTEEKIHRSRKTPDELIRAYDNNRRQGIELVYVS